MELVIVSNQRSLISQTTAETSVDKIEDPNVGENTSSVEGFDWELSNCHKTEEASNLGSGGVVGPVSDLIVHHSSLSIIIGVLK